MPPSIKTSRKDIINASISIVRNCGWENLNARDIAKILNCSTQPIFREFKNMEELKDTARREAWEIYNQYLSNYQKIEGKPSLSFGVAYVKFAKEEKNLFKLIFMSDEIKAINVADLAEIKDDRMKIIDIFMEISGLDRKKATKLHLNVWLLMHGLASMIATNQIQVTDEDIKELILSNFSSYKNFLKAEDKI